MPLATTDLHNALIFSGGIPPLPVPRDGTTVTTTMMFELMGLYNVVGGEGIVIDLVGNAINRLAEQYRKEPII